MEKMIPHGNSTERKAGMSVFDIRWNRHKSKENIRGKKENNVVIARHNNLKYQKVSKFKFKILTILLQPMRQKTRIQKNVKKKKLSTNRN